MDKLWRWLAPAAIAAALVALLVNDWALKPAQSFWVGKLSDLAGLFLIPVPLVGMFRSLAPRLPRIRARWLLAPLTWCAAVAVVFVAAKTSHWAAARLARWWPWPAAWGQARIVADPTDLLALAALPVGYAVAWAFWGHRDAQKSALRPTASARTCCATRTPPSAACARRGSPTPWPTMRGTPSTPSSTDSPSTG